MADPGYLTGEQMEGNQQESFNPMNPQENKNKGGGRDRFGQGSPLPGNPFENFNNNNNRSSNNIPSNHNVNQNVNMNRNVNFQNQINNQFQISQNKNPQINNMMNQNIQNNNMI